MKRTFPNLVHQNNKVQVPNYCGAVSHLTDHCTTVLKSLHRVGSHHNHSSAAFHPFSLQYATVVAWERFECPP